ncbi:MAG: DUF2490 domain-containing protein [Bacteroidota bacterium]
MIRIFAISFLFTVAISNISFSQTSNYGNWMIYFGNMNLPKKFNWHHEVQYRNYNIAGDLEQLLLRTGIGYNLSENNNNVLLGYGFIYSEPYLLGGIQKDYTSEHRIYQQFITKQNFGRVAIQHRYRIEERFLKDNFKLRFRYFLSCNVALNHKSFLKNTLYFAAYNEIFINGKANYFDRNRLYLGLGFKFSDKIKVEVGSLNQLVTGGSRNQLNLICFVNL